MFRRRISIFGNQKNVSQFLVLLPTLICIVSQLLLLIPSSSAYKILVYSQTLTRSHIILNARVAEALAADGHNVTILEVEYLEPLVEFSGSTAKGVRKISVGGREQLEEARAVVSKAIVTDSFVGQTLWTVLKSIPQNIEFQEMLNGMCETFLDEQAQLLEQLRAEKFDLFIGEQINFCGSALSKVMNIPVHVLLVSCPIQEHVASLLGLPFPSSFVPSIYGVPLTDRMSMAERFANLVGILVYGQSFHYGLDHLTGVFRRRFGDQFPAVSQIVSDSPLVFVNVDELVDFPRPIFPHVVYIGGLEFEQSRKKDGAAAAPASKPLDEPFRSQMERGRRGVVFFSLGSAVNTVYLPEQFRRNLFAAIAQLPDWHFLVKVSDDDALSRELASGMANVFLTGWAPQRAILGHPRTRLFISHGGYNSLLESALAGCPILSMGFFADQMRNALVPERNGWGRSFDKRLLLEGSEQFRGTLVDLLEQPGFQEGAKRLKNLLATKPFTAREKLVRHIRFLELNDGRLPELMPESRRLSTVVLYNLDLCALGLLSLVLVLALLFLMGRLAWRLCCFCWTRRKRGGGGGKAKEE